MRKVSVSSISDISALGLYMNVLVSKFLGMRNLLVIPFLVANDADPAACVNRVSEAGGFYGCGAGHHGGMLRRWVLYPPTSRRPHNIPSDVRNVKDSVPIRIHVILHQLTPIRSRSRIYLYSQLVPDSVNEARNANRLVAGSTVPASFSLLGHCRFFQVSSPSSAS